MPNTVQMKGPSGTGQVVGSQGSPPGSGGNYQADAQGYVTVDSRDVGPMLAAGFVFATPSVVALPRNLIDCADFTTNPWQGGTTTALLNGTNTAKITADRFFATGGTSSSWNVKRTANTDIAGFNQALEWGRSSTDTHTTGLTLGQVMETADSIRCQGLPVALSFWVKAGANFAAGGPAFTAALVSSTGTDDTAANLASGSWTGATNVISQAVTPSTTTTKFGPYYGTIPATCTQLGLTFAYTPAAATTAGANETVQFMGISLVADGVTTFEHLDVQEVLGIAQRYFYQLNEGTTGSNQGVGQALSTTTALIFLPTPETMRKNPTVTVSVGGFQVTNGGGAAVSVTAAGGAASTHSPNGLAILCTVASGLTAGQTSYLLGRTTNNGNVVAQADYV